MIIEPKYALLLSVRLYGKGEKLKDYIPRWVNRKDFHKTAVEKEKYEQGELGYTWDGFAITTLYEHKYISRPMTVAEISKLLSDFEGTCRTMGALTLEYGWRDAISFDSGDHVNAYVFPLYPLPDSYQEALGQFEFYRLKMEALHRRVMDQLERFIKDETLVESEYIDLETLPLFTTL